MYEGGRLVCLAVVQVTLMFFPDAYALAGLHIVASVSALYILISQGALPCRGQLCRLAWLGAWPMALLQALQLLAAFKSLERASVLFVASWLALGASWAPHAGGWRSKRGVPGHSLAILGLGTLALGVDLVAGSRPSILAVAWLTLWLGLEVFRVAWREGWRPRAPSTLGHALWAQAEDAHAALDAMSATFIQHVEGLAPLLLMVVLRLDKNIFTINQLTLPGMAWLLVSTTAWAASATLSAARASGARLLEGPASLPGTLPLALGLVSWEAWHQRVDSVVPIIATLASYIAASVAAGGEGGREPTSAM